MATPHDSYQKQGGQSNSNPTTVWKSDYGEGTCDTYKEGELNGAYCGDPMWEHVNGIKTDSVDNYKRASEHCPNECYRPPTATAEPLPAPQGFQWNYGPYIQASDTPPVGTCYKNADCEPDHYCIINVKNGYGKCQLDFTKTQEGIAMLAQQQAALDYVASTGKNSNDEGRGLGGWRDKTISALDSCFADGQFHAPECCSTGKYQGKTCWDATYKKNDCCL